MLPGSAKKYKETPVFTEDTVPRGLLADHNTAAGVWGRLVVLDGSLDFTRIAEKAVIVSPEQPMIIRPQERHHITCDRPVRFKVEFYRLEE